MNRSFDAVMRQAQSLMRSNKLTEATAAIQAALSGKAPAEPDREARPASHDGPELELEVERKAAPGASGDRSQAAFSAGAAASRAGPASAGAGAASPFASLGRGKLGALFAGGKVGLGLDGLQGLPGAAAKRPPSIPEGAQFVTLEHSGRHGSRAYKLYVPAALPAGQRPLVVMLHGCTQDPDDFAAGTQMNGLAEELGFLVAYPQQVRSANQQGCWNWFRPEDQRRDAGEPGIIAGIVADVVRDRDVDPAKVFAAGLSAGGAMAAILGEAYPDLFAAIGVHSGLPSGSAKDVMSALAVMRNGGTGPAHVSGKRPSRTIVFHGDKDATVHPSNGECVAMLGRGPRDGIRPAVKEGKIGGRAYKRTSMAGTSSAPEVEFWQVQGLAHAWSGGSSDGSYADPKGPDASREMLRFFLQDAR